MTQANNNVSALELKRHQGVRYKTAWLMKHKLLPVMAEREDRRVLDERDPNPGLGWLRLGANQVK